MNSEEREIVIEKIDKYIENFLTENKINFDDCYRDMSQKMTNDLDSNCDENSLEEVSEIIENCLNEATIEGYCDLYEAEFIEFSIDDKISEICDLDKTREDLVSEINEEIKKYNKLIDNLDSSLFASYKKEKMEDFK